MYLRSFVRNNNNIRRIIILLGDGYIYIHKSYIYTARRLPPVYIEFQPGSTLLLLFNIISIVPNCFICRGWHKVLFVKIASFTSHALELVSATPANEWRWGSGVQPLGARRLTLKWVTKGYMGVRHTRQVRWGSSGEASSYHWDCRNLKPKSPTRSTLTF